MKKNVHRYWCYAAIMLGLYAAIQSTKLSKIEGAIDKLYNYDITISIVDESTGAAIKNSTIHFPFDSISDRIPQRIGATATSDGKVIISGIAYEPRRWGFSAKGYERADVIVDKSTPPSLQVSLKPSQAEQDVENNATTSPEN